VKRSSERILTTHVGSLVRPPEILESILAQVSHQPYDQTAFEEQVREGVKDVVRKQAEVGIDIPSDGEYSKPSFAGYVTERLAGLESRPVERPASPGPMNYPLLNEEFPNFMAQYNAMYRTMWMPPSIPRALVDAAIRSGGTERASVVGPISYKGQPPLQRDLDNFRTALDGLQFEEAFVPSATPSRNDADPSHVYSTEEEYLYAVADAITTSTKPSSTPGTSSSWTSDCRHATRCCPASRRRAGRSCVERPNCRWRRTTTRCAAFRRTASAITCAGAA